MRRPGGASLPDNITSLSIDDETGRLYAASSGDDSLFAFDPKEPMSGKTTNDLERAERTAFHRRKILGEQTESSAGTGAVTLQPATDLNLGPNDVDQLDVEIHNAGTETVYLCRSGQTTGVPIAEGQTLREENVSADDGVFDLYGASAWGDVYVVWWTGDRS